MTEAAEHLSIQEEISILGEYAYPATCRYLKGNRSARALLKLR